MTGKVVSSLQSACVHRLAISGNKRCLVSASSSRTWLRELCNLIFKVKGILVCSPKPVISQVAAGG